MSNKFWVNDNLVTQITRTVRGNYLTSGLQSGDSFDMVFMVSHLEQADLLAQLNLMGVSDTLATVRRRDSNKEPLTHQTTPSRARINDAGDLVIGWPEAHGETLYPLAFPRPTSNEKPKTFLLLLTNTIVAKYMLNYPFKDTFGKFVVHAMGSIGDYQSGADLEFEGLNKWTLGRPLYIPNNELRLPLKITR